MRLKTSQSLISWWLSSLLLKVNFVKVTKTGQILETLCNNFIVTFVFLRSCPSNTRLHTHSTFLPYLPVHPVNNERYYLWKEVWTLMQTKPKLVEDAVNAKRNRDVLFYQGLNTHTALLQWGSLGPRLRFSLWTCISVSLSQRDTGLAVVGNVRKLFLSRHYGFLPSPFLIVEQNHR